MRTFVRSRATPRALAFAQSDSGRLMEPGTCSRAKSSFARTSTTRMEPASFSIAFDSWRGPVVKLSFFSKSFFASDGSFGAKAAMFWVVHATCPPRLLRAADYVAQQPRWSQAHVRH